MNLETPFELKKTNVSQPRLSHSQSQQSLAVSQTASEGYYSLSASDNTSSTGENDSTRRYQTPPSHTRTPAASHEQLPLQHQNQPLASLRGIGVPRQHPASDRPVSTIAEERERPDTAAATMDSASVNTTPGQDTTPYIRFAIDQLTRDEEVRGSRSYPLENEARQPAYHNDDEEDYPVERIVSDDSLGYMRREQETQRRLSQLQPQKPPPQHTPALSRDSIARVHNNPTPTQARPQNDVFIAHPAPQAQLSFLPAILRPLWLAIFTLLCILMLAALIFCAVFSTTSESGGLWDYLAFGDNRYFVFRYLPTLLGTLLFLWLIQIQVALQRMVPFISMGSSQYHKRSEAIFLPLQPMQFFSPRLEYFRAGQPLVGACFVVFWLFSWTVPLLASCFNVRFDTEDRVWRWTAVQGVIWTTVVLYALLVIALSALFFFLRNETGLKWDPRSLADIIVLLERSNVVNDFAGSETFEKKDWEYLKGRPGRIGFWTTTRRPKDVFHGLGEEGAPARRFSVEDGWIREKSAEREYPDTAGTKKSGARPSDFSIRMDIRSPAVRLRYLPWYLRNSSVVVIIITALLLLIAFLVVSFLNNAVRLGFLPQVFARTNASGFSASNFLYSFVPALIGQLLFLAVLTFDYSLRALRPYMSLSSKGGATAEASLLVDYASRLPLSATFAALENQHYQNAILSLVSFCSAALPVLAGGCFWSQWYPNDEIVRVAADPSGYYALCFFLALYALSLTAMWPSRHRAALPHASNNLAEIISWLYQSPVLTDRSFNRPKTKPELVARLMGSAYLERTWAQSLTSLVRPSRDNLRAAQTEKKHHSADTHDSTADPGKIKYGFGIHVGRDGQEHLGIDRVHRGGGRSGRELVIWEEQNRKSWVGSAA
ncbi:hypothetical protein DM02DRAFT_616170 [Periconia macrospinosa]|uniref:Phosphoribosylaminoimidazole-succinocarboxamide synthase n=1 Tax=Periconia macrospinosa TaxID=97972 RepID=A0A2V1DJX6_9PLEO|nr:hypothetical protein DM02DRAFT_616170 [Periconia macrospinosa]